MKNNKLIKTECTTLVFPNYNYIKSCTLLHLRTFCYYNEKAGKHSLTEIFNSNNTIKFRGQSYNNKSIGVWSGFDNHGNKEQIITYNSVRPRVRTFNGIFIFFN